MKHSLILALWSVGALGGPCKPARPSDYALTSTDSQYLPPGTSPTQSGLTLLGQETTVETSTATRSSGGEDGQISASHSTESDFSSFTQGSGSPSGATELTGTNSETGSPSHIPGQTDGDVTDTGSSALGSVESTQVPGTGTATDIAGQPSGDADSSGSTSVGSQLTGIHATETATGLPDQSSGAVTDGETAHGPSGTVSAVLPGGTSADVSGSVTVPGQPGGTGDASATGTSTGRDSEASGDSTGTATLPDGQPGATGVATDGTTGGVQDSTQTGAGSSETGSPGSPNDSISDSTGIPTGTEQGQGSATDVTNTASVVTNGSGETTSPVTTDTGIANTEVATSGTGTQESVVPTIISNGQETTGFPEQTQVTSDQSQHESAGETTASDAVNTSPVDTTSEGAQPSETEHATRPTTDAISEPTSDHSDTSSANETPGTVDHFTTTNAAVTTDGNDTPSTTAPGGDIPSLTAIPMTTTAPHTTSLPTITDVPEGFAPTTVSGHPEWTTNTWITTTSDDSGPTVVPVLVGCSKCGGSGSGIILWGFPHVTGTWFQLPGLPKFEFPCIPPGCTTPPATEESDGDDDDKPSSTTCTDKVTVTDCFVACTTYTGPGGDTITPSCSTTCTKTQTGCSVTGTTTTSSTAACGPSGDSSCQTCTRTLESDSDPETLERRGLDRRGAKSGPSNLGGCTFAMMPQFPEYPGGDLVLDNDADIVPKNSPLKDIHKWWLTTFDSNCLPVLNGNLPAATYIKDRTGGDIDRPSIDHVYEKSMLLDFFRQILDTNAPNVKGLTKGPTPAKISCSDMESYGGAGAGSTNNLLQTVFDAYPGAMRSNNKKNPTNVRKAQYMEDFIGMDQWTNGDAKGAVANAEELRTQCSNLAAAASDVTAATSEKDAATFIEKKVSRLERMAIGVEMFSAPEAIDAMVRQNQRIYARLMDIDSNAKTCMKDPAVQNGIWSFAQAYKDFMADRFDGTKPWSINDAVTQSKDLLLNKLQSDLKEAPNVKAANAQDWKNKIAGWQTRLTNMADANRQWAVPDPAWVWTWVQKRDGDGLSCDRPVPSFTTTSEESTTFATSTRTTSESEDSTSEQPTSAKEVTSSSPSPTSSTTEAPIRLTDLPTLTDAPPLSISTPDGSSCASTATYTQCNQGTGHHGDACVVNSQCASWVNTRTTSTPGPTPTMDTPDPSKNEKHCYNSGQQSNYDAITYAAESFCRDVVSKNKDNGYYWSNDKLEEKKTPSTGYHFALLFQVNEGCLWKADYDECMRYMKVPIDACNCSAKGNKQGGWVQNNCITAKIDPNSGQ